MVISDVTNAVVATVTGLNSPPNTMVYDSGKGEIFVSENGAGCDI